MLFDLRGRGRRRTVRVIYIGLAVLIGLGLVGFGIGGGLGSGGIFSSISENEGKSRASFQASVKKYERQTRLDPTNVAAWEALTKALLNEAGGGSNESGSLTSRERELYVRAAESWSRYLALKPPKPNGALAVNMVRVFSEAGLNRPQEAVAALQVVVAERPTSAALWGELAQYAYKAHDNSGGDLAAAKAVSLSPKEQQARVKQELAEVKADPNGEKTYTTTTNGTVYAVKRASNGQYTGTQIGIAPKTTGGTPGTLTATTPAK